MTWQVFATDQSTAEALDDGLTRGQVAHRCQVITPAGIPDAVADALDHGFRRIAIEGGDPEIAAAIAEVREHGVGRQTDLAVITRDSDLMRTFAAEQTVDGAIERMARHTPYLIDAGLVDGEFGEMVFVNAVAAGVLAAGPAWFPWWPRPVLPARRVAVAAGDTVTESVASGALVLNGQFWGNRIAAPRSTMVDGVFDVQVFNGHRMALSRLRRTMRTGMHVRSHHVRRRALADVRFEAPRAWPITVDGIRVGRGAFRAVCLPGAVRLAI